MIKKNNVIYISAAASSHLLRVILVSTSQKDIRKLEGV